VNNYPVTIHHLYISPGHNYFTHRYDDRGDHPTWDVAEVAVHAGQGLVGDRFYGRGPAFDGHVTFFAWEVFQLLQQSRDGELTTPTALRRNVIIEGVPLNQLIGHKFAIDGVHFYGAKHCAPCRWMDEVVATGALAFLKGRGGLRAQALSDGVLHRGAAMLTTAQQLDPTQGAARLPRPRLP
jgi:MOSC domain-containing protein YiiM